MSCSGENCNSNQIANVKYNLCDNCNSIRLTGKSKSERQAESALKFRNSQIANSKQNGSGISGLVKSTKRTHDRGLFVRNISGSVIANKVKTRTPIKQQTSREAGIKSKLSVLKMEIELEAVQNNEYFCCGCGKSHPGLDKSHILSVGQFKYLELVKENIQLMDRDCHIIWESGAIDEQMNLHCFVDNVCFIYLHEREQYQKFITRMETYLESLGVADNSKFEMYSKKYLDIVNKCG